MRVHIANYRRDNKPRKMNVHIDRWDTWSMDHTLALIIYPMLLQLQKDKHGGPKVDDEDVPEAIKSTSAPPVKNEWDTDEFWFDRWDYVLDEMIFAFKAIAEETWEDEFHTGNMDITWNPVDNEGNPVDEKDAKLFEMGHGPNHTHVFDKEGFDKVNARISNGTRLFGKYYRALWD